MSKINVLFMQSQTYFGSDSMIHSLVMRNLDRQVFDVHVACNKGSAGFKPASLNALKGVPQLKVRPTHFGTTVNFRSRAQIVKDTLVGAAPAITSLIGLANYVRKNNIHIIHGTEKPRDAFYGVLLGKLSGARSIVHLHVGVNHEWMSPLTQWAMRNADGLLGVSAFVAETARKSGYDPNKVYWVVNSLDATLWDPETDGSAIRREFQIAPETTLISIASRLTPYKGQTQLLQALDRLKHEFTNWKLMIVGEDDPRATPGHGSYTAELKGLVRELGIEDKVIFTGFRTDIKQILAASDFYAMPSYEEPCAVAFIEAMAMRKPVIALDSGGTAHMVEHERSGLLSRPYDVPQLAENLRRLLADPALVKEMGVRARERVEQYLNPQRMTNEVAEVYHKVLRAKPGVQSQRVRQS